MANIVCRYCGHGKHWHRFNPEACLALDAHFTCDCPAWEYGIDEDALPTPEEEEEVT